jgi:hypothetical protein
MLQWNDLHPYHAVHVVRLRGHPDAQTIRKGITRTLRAHGLGALTLDRASRTFRFDAEPGPVEVREVAPGSDPIESLRQEMEHQLNQRIAVEPAFSPFRFFVIPELETYLLGLTYFHAVADAESVTLLLRQIAGALSGRIPARVNRLDCHPPRHDGFWSSLIHQGPRKLLGLSADVRRMRRAHRPPLRDVEDLTNRVQLLHAEPVQLMCLIQSAKRWGVTVNDVLLALLMRAVAPLAADRLAQSRRRDIALATIVNVRRQHNIDSAQTFGLFLGSFVVSHPMSEPVSIEALARALHVRTEDVKRRRAFLATPLELRLANWLMSWSPPSRQKKFYHKHQPLWGGITNMNLNNLWPDAEQSGSLDYFRTVSTGPVTPLALSATTFAEHVNIAVSYRPAVFDDPAIEQVRSGLTRQFESLMNGE